MKKILIFLLVAFSASSNAQDIIDLSQIEERIEQNSPPEKNLPVQTDGLIEEKRIISDEISRLSNLTKYTGLSKEISKIDSDKQAINKALRQLESIECEKLSQDGFPDDLERMRKEHASLMSDFDEMGLENPWDEAPRQSVLSGSEPWTDSQKCVRWKKFFSDASASNSLQSSYDELKRKYIEYDEESKKKKQKAEILISLLKTRRQAVTERLSKEGAQADLTKSMWGFILAIGGFSLGVVAIITRFDRQIQFEWVASGQVIQFATVMILLVVIMSLGLTGVLKDNTLGTLLGGIGGYVLAQGVGRAAAREAMRSSVRAVENETKKASETHIPAKNIDKNI